MSKLIEKLNFLGSKEFFNLNGSKKHQNLFGGILSLFTIIISAVACGYFSYLMLSRTSYNVIVSDEYNDKPFKNWTNAAASVVITDINGRLINDSEKYFGIKAIYLTNTPFINKNGIINHNINITNVDLETCSLNEHFQENFDLWKDHPFIGNANCIPRNQILNSTLTFGVVNFTSILIYVHKCTNTTQIKNCASQQDIDLKLTSLILSLRFINYYYDHDKFNEPAVPYVYNENIPISATVYKSIQYNFMNVEYISDNGFIFPEPKSYLYTMITQGNTIYSVDLRNNTLVPNSFGVIGLTMDSLKKKFIRRYYKAQNMIADVGGIIKGFILISSFFYYFFKENMFYIDLINSDIERIMSLDSKEDGDHRKPKILKKIKKGKGAIKMNLKESNNDNQILSSTDKINNNILSSENINYDSSKDLQKFHVKKVMKKINTDKVYEESIRKIIPLNEGLRTKDIKIEFDPSSKKECKSLNLSFFEIINPFSCFNQSQNYKQFIDLIKIIESELEIRNILIKLNMIDKLTFIFTGDKYKKLLELSPNPFKKNIINEECESFMQQDLEELSNFIVQNIKHITITK
jgi:hypothetical protein